MNLQNTLGRFRLLAVLEGISFLLIIFVTMPMKYMFDMPEANKVIGMIHGLLFVVYMYMLIPLKQNEGFSNKEIMYLILASILPFGTFVADHKILKKKAV